MPFFDSAGVQIHYEVFGAGKPIVLVHGFAANLQANWVAPGWVETLRPIRRVIALDCRGHGESDKPHDPDAEDGARLTAALSGRGAAYGRAMQDDVVRLMDQLRIDKADLFGYSMGGAISMGLMVRYPERFSSVVLGGVGGRAPRRGPDSPIAKAMLAKDVSEIKDEVAKGFRIFAERLGNDLKALAAVNQSNRFTDIEALRSVTLPVLIVVGENDALVGGAEPLAKAIPNARLITIPGRDHLTVVGDRRFKDAVVDFLSVQQYPGVPPRQD